MSQFNQLSPLPLVWAKGAGRLERADHLPVVEFGSLHVAASDRQAVRPVDMNVERSVVEARAFALEPLGALTVAS
jgi:hypothetical protein